MTPTTPNDESARPRPAIDWAGHLAQHERWLRTVILARLGERQAVDDVWQEVSLAVAAGRNLPSDATKVAPWLYRLAVLQSLMYRRKQGRQRKLVDRYARRSPSGGAAAEPDPLQWLLADERRRLVRTALEQLAPRDAEILLLKYSQDWNYHQLSRHLGVSPSAVESRLHRARGRLREILSPNRDEAHARV